jgi:medium-chain acyl-[acyl-carrier-protein] hydrolase
MEMHTDFIITPADLDANGELSPIALLDRMQRVAGEHGHALGVGREALLARGMVWVLASNAFTLKRPVMMGETIGILTFLGENTRAACPRYFNFTDEGGHNIGGGATLWVLINVETRRIVPPHKAGIFADVSAAHEPALPLFSSCRRPENPTYTRMRAPAYSDFDSNGHVNNVRIAAWALDALPMQSFEDGFVGGMQISYHREIGPLDNCLLQVETLGEDNLLNAKSAEDNSLFFEAEIRVCKRS